MTIRNIAIVGHGGAGKTLLTEAILLEAGLTKRVPAGIMDYAADEKDTGHSIDSALAQFSHDDVNYTLIDNPGYTEFIQHSINSLDVVETAMLVLSASDGVTIMSKRIWKRCRPYNRARFIVVTKLDGDNVSFDDTVAQIREEFGEKCLPLIVPNASGPGLSTVHNVFDDEGFDEYRDQLVEAIVETNDEMMEKYLEGETVSTDRLREQLRVGICQDKIFPIVTVVPTSGIGVKEVLTCIKRLAPAPEDIAHIPATVPGSDEQIEVDTSADGNFAAKAFKIYNDPFGRITFFRVFRGSVSAGSNVYIVNGEKTERFNTLITYCGKDAKNIDEAKAGQIFAVSKIEGINCSDTLADEKNQVQFAKVVYPTPMVELAVQPLSRSDEQKISSSLIKLSEEDLTFKARREQETGEVVVSGMSTLHLDILLTRLKSRFKVECSAKLPKIPYRETLTGNADTRYRHKKQSGGHGQFGEVAIKLAPTERGKGFEFINKIVGGVVPSQFVASTEKGIAMTLEKGILAGYPIVDVEVTLYDGKTHDVDSSDAAFQIAGSKAFQQGFAEAKPVLMEPVCKVSVIIPEKFMGDIMGDMNGRRGRIMGYDSESNLQIVKANVPMSEMMTYSTELKAITGGEGIYSSEFSHYDIVPSNIQEKLIAQMKKEQEEK